MLRVFPLQAAFSLAVGVFLEMDVVFVHYVFVPSSRNRRSFCPVG